MKNFTNDELTNHINNAIDKLKNLLFEFQESNKKRAALLGYWINDYVHYLTMEDDFVPPQQKYNRGDIVQVNFGYRLGRELGGRHFAVVVDAHNNINSGIVTVIPLTSKKENSRNTSYTTFLNKGLYELHDEKLKKLLVKGHLTDDRLNKLLKELTQKRRYNKEDEKKLLEAKLEMEKFKKQVAELQMFVKQLEKLKLGTVAQISQITTISKMRISNPKNSKDSLNGIKLSNEDLDLISENIKKLYLK